VDLKNYPIDGSRMKKLLNAAVMTKNIDATIGALSLQNRKNSTPDLKKDFPISYALQLYRILYLIS